MTKRTKVAAAVGGGLLVVLALLALRGGSATRPTVAGQPARGPRVHWPADKRYTYAVSWQAKTGGEVAPGQDGKSSQPLAMESSAIGEIALERVADIGSGSRVAVCWSRLDTFSFGIQGQAAQGDPAKVSAALLGQSAFLDIDDRGRIGSIAFPPEMDPGVRAILRSLALELRYSLPELQSTDWEAAERDSLGDVRVRYHAGMASMARESIKYEQLDAVAGALAGTQRLRGGALISLDPNGLPLTIEESVNAAYTRPESASPALQSSWHFTMHRQGEGPASPGLVAAALRARAQPLGAQIDDPDRDHRRDERLAAGMSFDTVTLAVDRFETGTRPGFQFLAKSAAWLRLHPEDLAAMTTMFQSKDLTVKGRGLILDLLAETGSPAAQKAMRDMLSSDAARAQPRDFGVLVQRFTFVRAPERGSVEFLQREYQAASQSSNVPAAQGAVVALGSAVRRLDGHGDHALAAEVNERLRTELRQAATPELRGALVAALGNAGRAEDVPDLVAVARDQDVRVRDQVASALRTVDSKEARAGLLTLAADSSSAVAITAFGSLGKQSLEDGDWQALADLAQGGKTPPSSDAALVDLVREKGKARPEGRQILNKLLERNQGADSDLPAVIRDLLDKGKGS